MRFFTLLLAILIPAAAWAGEVKLREFHSAGGTVVRLSDIAEFTNLPADVRSTIEGLPLIPAPAPGQSRRVSAQDVREIMSLYGISLPAVRVSGECRVEGSVSASANTSRVTPSELV